MPSKNIVKIYLKDGIYHIYNRGVEKRNIFMDDQDYKVFLHLLKRYLLPPEDKAASQVEPVRRLPEGRQNDIYKEIRLLCYCLMPNHFHLMIQQLTERVITDFIRRLTNSYTKYFNEKYERVGPLFQGRYRAALIKEESYFLHLPYYIHHNPKELFIKVKEYPWSSYADYLGRRNTLWLYKKGLMDYFIESEKGNFDLENSKEVLKNLILE